jgi:hypothetical protein
MPNRARLPTSIIEVIEPMPRADMLTDEIPAPPALVKRR